MARRGQGVVQPHRARVSPSIHTRFCLAAPSAHSTSGNQVLGCSSNSSHQKAKNGNRRRGRKTSSRPQRRQQQQQPGAPHGSLQPSYPPQLSQWQTTPVSSKRVNPSSVGLKSAKPPIPPALAASCTPSKARLSYFRSRTIPCMLPISHHRTEQRL